MDGVAPWFFLLSLSWLLHLETSPKPWIVSFFYSFLIDYFLCFLHVVCCLCLQIVKLRKQRNRDTIWQACHDLVVSRACFLSVQSWHDFRLAGQVFRIRLVVPWVVRTKRVTILTVVGYYLSVLVQILK